MDATGSWGVGERERDRETETESEQQGFVCYHVCVCVCTRAHDVCLCVCVHSVQYGCAVILGCMFSQIELGRVLFSVASSREGSCRTKDPTLV